MRDATSGRRSSHRRKRAVTRDKPADGSQDRHGAIAILDAGDMDKQSDQVTGRVGNDVPLAALDLLASIKATGAATFRGSNRLAIDDARGRTGLSSSLLARRHHQRMVDQFPASISNPDIEVSLDGRIGRKLLRQLAPLASRRGDVEQGLDDRTQPGRATSPKVSPPGHEGHDHRLFRIGQIACIAQVGTPILRPSDFSPGH